jgi:hypothetical protein
MAVDNDKVLHGDRDTFSGEKEALSGVARAASEDGCFKVLSLGPFEPLRKALSPTIIGEYS